MKNASVIVLNDLGVQTLLAISKDGALYVSPAGLVNIELPALKKYFETFAGGEEARQAALNAIEEVTRTPS